MKPTASLADALDAALPQTQCTRCGFPDCRSYAEAMAEGAAPVDRCPPGGAEGIARLAQLIGTLPTPLDAAHGIEGPRQLACIVEDACIGCTLCIQACPVDCIVGAPKRMHTVVASQCTGCELCLPACPVDCITLHTVTGERTGWQAWSAEQAGVAQQRHDARRARQARDRAAHEALLAAASPASPVPSPPAGSAGPKPEMRRSPVVEAALARARAAQRA